MVRARHAEWPPDSQHTIASVLSCRFGTWPLDQNFAKINSLPLEILLECHEVVVYLMRLRVLAPGRETAGIRPPHRARSAFLSAPKTTERASRGGRMNVVVLKQPLKSLKIGPRVQTRSSERPKRTSPHGNYNARTIWRKPHPKIRTQAPAMPRRDKQTVPCTAIKPTFETLDIMNI